MNDQFQNFITSHGDLIQLALFISLFFISWNLENLYGVLFMYRKWKHAFVNAPFIFTNLPVMFVLGLAFVGVIKWTSLNHFGLLYFFNFDKSPLLLFLTSFLLLDLGEYIYHRLMHKVKTLLEVSCGPSFRHHR